jgi:predicted metalloendopeptidase
MNDLTLDQLIDHEHGAAVKAEEDAVAIERRLRLANLDHADGFFSQPRAFGQARNPFGSHKNLTISSQLQKKDPQLASYLAKAAGAALPAPDYASQEREAARQASIQHLQEETARLAELNESTRQRQAAQRHANLPNRPGSGALLL